MRRVAVVIALIVAFPVSWSAAAVPNAREATCHKVGRVTMKIIAKGLNRGRAFDSGGYAVRSGNRSTPWFIAARIRSRGIAVWATDITPTLVKQPPAAFIQAANAVAWHNSQWGVSGSFPKNYPSAPTVPPLGSPGIRVAAACVP
jgi:hypothetical protein